jgi:hypothetical protein
MMLLSRLNFPQNPTRKHPNRAKETCETYQNNVQVVAESVDDPSAVLIRPDHFARFSVHCSRGLGSRWAFIAAIAAIALWALTGPLFHYPDTWQLVINTGTTIITFLMVFIIQNTQNRDARPFI